MKDTESTSPPLGGYVELGRFASEEEARGLGFTLEGSGLRCRVVAIWEADSPGWQWSLLVPRTQEGGARRILAEERPRRSTAKTPSHPAPAAPALAWVIGLAALDLLLWMALELAGGSEQREVLLRFGAGHAPAIRAGHVWVLITAIFLHIGLKHLLANMASLAVLGPPVLRVFGAGRFYAMYLGCGIAGNVVSFLIAPTGAVKAGASGAILGLLGVLAGDRVRRIREPSDRPSRFKTWHIVAMLVAFYGFVVGTGQVDHLAHLGGLATGIVLGLMMPRAGELPPRRERRLDWALGIVSGAAVVASALLQLGFGSPL